MKSYTTSYTWISTVSLCLILLTGCDNRFEFLEKVNQAPVLSIDVGKGPQAALSGEIKTSLKHNNLPYPIRLLASDKESKLTAVYYQILTGNGNLIQNRETLQGTINLEGGLAELSFEPVDPGRVVIEFTAQDEFKKRTVARAELNVFLNKPPVARLKAEFVGAKSPYEFRLDASESLDQDAEQGGEIIAYRFIINGSYTITSTQPSALFIFPGPGPNEREVKLEVIDSDGAKAETTLVVK